MIHRTRSLRLPVAAAAVACALLIGGCSAGPGGAAPAQTVVGAPTASNPLAAGGLQDPRANGSAQAPASTGIPVRLRIPAIGVDSALEDLSLDAGGQLAAPVDYDRAGWYAQGVVPGALGPAVIAGHIDSPTAPAVFARLGELTGGETVVITMSNGHEVEFVTTGAAQAAKASFPTADVYDGVPAPELRLITCAGAFDTAAGHYTDNLIVFATLHS